MTPLRALVLLALLCAARPGPLAAQIPYYVFDPSTKVASIDFSFPNGRTFDEDELLEQMALGSPGWLDGVRGTLSFLPLVSAPPPYLFAPLDLQRDVARLRMFYARSGFLDTDVRYEVEYDEDDNAVDVDMIVAEGRPIVLRSLEVVTTDGENLTQALPDSLVGSWEEFDESRRGPVGKRYTEATGSLLVGDVLQWWTNRGWAFARASSTLQVDTAAAAAELSVRVDPGPRARIDTIVIEGADNVSEDVIRGAVPFREGDWFSSERLSSGQRRLFSLELFRLVLVGAPTDQPRDSSVTVRVRLQESPPRLVTGEIGYVSAGGGITTRGQLAHRNFTGGARTLRLDALLQTGALSLMEKAEREYRFSVSYRRPFTFHPLLTLTVSPFGSYRDDLVDRSWEVGLLSSLIFEVGPYSFVTLGHQYSSHKVLDYRLGSANALDLATLIELIGAGALDTLDDTEIRSTLSLSATLGRFDPTRRRDALQARPTFEVTTPRILNTIEYARVDVPLIGYLPFGRGFALAAKAQAGRVFPFGKTVAGDSIAGVVQQAQLRSVLLTAGGTGSVRGWGNGLVGPKFPNLVFTATEGGDSLRVVTDGYIPSRGFARVNGSLEVRTPVPGLSERWGTFFFLDVGRVWTPDSRFRGDDPNDEDSWFYGTGAGLDVSTLVGPVRVSVGYKLNPSPLDLRDAREVFAAMLNERPISSVPTKNSRRFHLHVALGSAF